MDIPSEGAMSVCKTMARNKVLENLLPFPELISHSTCLFGSDTKVSARAMMFFMLIEAMESESKFCNTMSKTIT
jgi:hypothetical protein